MSLLDCTTKILGIVESVSKRPVRVQEDPTLQLLATVTIARGSAPFHMVKYRPMLQQPPDYKICYECGFIVRLFENPPESRFVFGPSPEASSKMDDLLADRSLLPQVRQMKDMLLQGILTQLRSVPIGLRVDEWLWEFCPSLRDQQISATKMQLQQNVQTLDPGIRRSFPKKIVDANTAINAAYAVFWADRLKDPAYALPYRSIGANIDGETLLDISKNIEPRPDNDWSLVDRWAEQLGLRDWYKWIGYSLEN
jgi:hypothetical protein